MAGTVLIVDRVPHLFFNGVTRYMRELAATADTADPSLRLRILFWAAPLRPRTWLRIGTPRPMPQKVRRMLSRFGLPWAEWLLRPDAIHFPAHDVPARWLHTRRPCLISIHGAAAQVSPEWDTSSGRAAQLRDTMRAARERDIQTITFSNFAKNEIIAHYGLAPERVAVIPHGIDHERFRQLPAATVEAFRRARGLDQPYFLFIGPCAPRKNVIRMIEAFARVKRSHGVPHQFLIAGRDHPGAREVAERVDALGIADAVRFLGPVDDGDLALLHNGAHAFAFVSLYEGFGMPILEAMACGTPVVTSALGGTGEVAGDAAALVSNPEDVGEIGDAMARTLDEAEHDRLRQAGLRRAAEFDWRRSARAHLDLYQTVMQRSGT